jgi:hypothetical protein
MGAAFFSVGRAQRITTSERRSASRGTPFGRSDASSSPTAYAVGGADRKSDSNSQARRSGLISRGVFVCRMPRRAYVTLPCDEHDVGVRPAGDLQDRRCDHGFRLAAHDAVAIGAEESARRRGFETVRCALRDRIEAAHRRHRSKSLNGASADRLVLRSGYVRRSRGDWFGRSACPERSDTTASVAATPTGAAAGSGTTGCTVGSVPRRPTGPTSGSTPAVAGHKEIHHGSSSPARRHAQRKKVAR